jgi:hypothetical protein
MKKFWLVKIHPVFTAIDEATGKELTFKNWREDLFGVMASSAEQAKATAKLTGYEYGIHYHDIVEEIGRVD